MTRRFVALSASILLLTACSGTPQAPEVVSETRLDLEIGSRTLIGPDLEARVEHMSDGTARLAVSDPWLARHRFSHPMLEAAWTACRNEDAPQTIWQLDNPEIRSAGNGRITALTAEYWQALDAADVPSEAEYDDAGLHATLRFNDDAVAVDGSSLGRVRAGSEPKTLARRLTARITGISQNPDQTRLDRETVWTRRLQVELVNHSQHTWRLNLERSGGELGSDILTGTQGRTSPVIYPGSTTTVEIPLLLPALAEEVLGAPRPIGRVAVTDMNGYQWQPDSRPVAQRIHTGFRNYNAAAYLVLEGGNGQQVNGFVDGQVMIDLVDTVEAITCR